MRASRAYPFAVGTASLEQQYKYNEFYDFSVFPDFIGAARVQDALISSCPELGQPAESTRKLQLMAQAGKCC